MSISEKLTKISENQKKVYDARLTHWFENYQVGDQGTQNWEYRYAGAGWHRGTFKPTMDMRPLYPQNFFARFDALGYGKILGYEENDASDLTELLNENGVTLDFSLARYMDNVFSYARFSRIGVVDCSSAISATRAFQGLSYTHTIDKLIVNENMTYANAFAGATALENITIEGTIGNDIDFRDCTKLTPESMTSIGAALQNNYSNPGQNTIIISSATNDMLNEAGTILSGLTWYTCVTANMGWNVTVI